MMGKSTKKAGGTAGKGTKSGGGRKMAGWLTINETLNQAKRFGDVDQVMQGINMNASGNSVENLEWVPGRLRRAPGFYWVRLAGGSGEIVAEWRGQAWFITGGSHLFRDNDFEWIGEKVERGATNPSNEPNKEGHYWIRIKGDWKPVVGQWHDEQWLVDGCLVNVEWVGDKIG